MSSARGKIMQMQQDRILGRIGEPVGYDNQMAELSAMDAANWRTPPLAPAPCVRVKATGEIHEWAPFFASRPDLCENCDEHGNTDPAAWQGRTSPHFKDNMERHGMPMAPMETPPDPLNEPKEEKPAGPVPPPPPGLSFNMEEFTGGILEGSNPDMASAHLALGVPQRQDYAQVGAIRVAMPLSNKGDVSVTEAVHAVFHGHI